MGFYGLADGTSMSTLFGSSSYSKTTNNLNFLSDYASIKNGSYRKLMNAYYGGNSKVDAIVPDNGTATSKDSAKKLAKVEDSANNLKESADALYKTGTNSVFKQVDIKQEDGTTKKGYDTEAILKKVSQFVGSYNDMLNSTGDVSSNSLDRAVKNLNTVTKANAQQLSNIGIDMKADGSLSLNTDAFKKADMSKVKDLFSGTGSYGYQVSARASMVDYAAGREASKANTYNRYGSYNNNYSFSYNDYI